MERSPHGPGDHAVVRSCGGWGTKLHVAAVTAVQAHESAVFERLMETADTPRTPWMVAGDKGYSCTRVR